MMGETEDWLTQRELTIQAEAWQYIGMMNLNIILPAKFSLNV